MRIFLLISMFFLGTNFNFAVADSGNSAKNSKSQNRGVQISNLPTSSSWLMPSTNINVKAGSSVKLKFQLVTTASQSVNVTGAVGTNFLLMPESFVPSSPILIGQNVGGLTGIATGSKVVSVKNNRVVISSTLTQAISGSVNFSGSGVLTNIKFVSLFLTPCSASAPVITIDNLNPANGLEHKVDNSGMDKGRGNDDSQDGVGKYFLNTTWKVPKNFQAGCFEIYARAKTTLTSSPITNVANSDLKNSASISIITRRHK